MLGGHLLKFGDTGSLIKIHTQTSRCSQLASTVTVAQEEKGPAENGRNPPAPVGFTGAHFSPSLLVFYLMTESAYEEVRKTLGMQRVYSK